MFTGVDVGTSEVRIYNEGKVINLPLETYHGRYITQSSIEIFNHVSSNISPTTKSLAISATCSIVLTEKFTIDEDIFLRPYDLENGNDVLLWMDNSATHQTNLLNNKLKSSTILSQLGGKLVSELSLPKLKHINDEISRDLVVFELYDWITYLFLHQWDGIKVKYVKSEHFKSPSTAVDGSIKGWSRETLNFLNIDVEIGRSESQSENGLLLPLGHPIGKIPSSDILLVHGCIDSYAGLLTTYSPNSISMVAGTSTCFLYTIESDGEKCQYFDGVWGPFEIMKQGTLIYEFGQPATGKLYERLYKHHNSNTMTDFFDIMESETVKLEEKFSTSINHLIKGYFYYGDVFGNRSPYMDSEMSEMIIDNTNGLLPRIIDNNEEIAIVIKYNLIIEFLAFQTAHLLSNLTFDNIVISGSQRKNSRFLQLLSTMIQKPIRLSSSDNVKGACMMSEIGYLMKYEHVLYPQAFDKVINAHNPHNDNFHISPSTLNHNLLFQKYKVYKHMAQSQIEYRKLINE